MPLFLGGVIAPGVNLSLKALHDAAAALPFIDVTRPDRVIGINTVACMQSGIYWGYVAMIEGLLARVRAEIGRPVTCIANATFSWTVLPGKSRKSWNTVPIWRRSAGTFQGLSLLRS